jgi:hypothetical protein
MALSLWGCFYVGPSCAEMGGTCEFPGSCQGTLLNSDVCNPTHNPGGSTCCLPCPGTQVFIDGGCSSP